MTFRGLIRVVAAWNPKARAWVNGRKGLFGQLEKSMAKGSGPVIWMHCASLGEFEQGRPLLEAIKLEHPGHRILLTFFSPSGYEVRKDHPGADIVCYLPADTARNAARFLSVTSPVLAIFVKYEHWYHILSVLKKEQVPVLLISAIFRDGQPFFRSWGGFWRKMLSSYDRIFVQDRASLERLAAIGLSGKTEVSGDTRFDRVITLARQSGELPAIAAFRDDFRVIVAGSTWEGDERILADHARKHPGLRYIIAPHEIREKKLAAFEDLFPSCIRYTAWEKMSGTPEAAAGKWQVLLIDNIGMLSRLYRYADITFVGGGFERSGIHNILEAAVYGKPVVFGPVHQKSREAADLRSLGGAFSVEDAAELSELTAQLLADERSLQEAGAASAGYVENEAGATDRIMQYIHANRLLTS